MPGAGDVQKGAVSALCPLETGSWLSKGGVRGNSSTNIVSSNTKDKAQQYRQLSGN